MVVAVDRVHHLCPRKLLHEPAHHHLLVQEPVPVLGKGGEVPERIVGAQTDEPAEQLL